MQDNSVLVYHYLLQTGYTALHLAASRGHVEVVRALLVTSRSINNQDKTVCVFQLCCNVLYELKLLI